MDKLIAKSVVPKTEMYPDVENPKNMHICTIVSVSLIVVRPDSCYDSDGKE